MWDSKTKTSDNKCIIRVFAENLVGLGFLYSVSYINPIPTHEKLFAVGKSGPTTTSNIIFLGLG